MQIGQYRGIIGLIIIIIGSILLVISPFLSWVVSEVQGLELGEGILCLVFGLILLVLSLISFVMITLLKYDSVFEYVLFVIPLVVFAALIVTMRDLAVYGYVGSGLSLALAASIITLSGAVIYAFKNIVGLNNMGSGTEVKNICGSCGKQVKKNMLFCPNCGGSIRESNTTDS